MKRMWSRDNRGMTFVEVLCAVAILALVTGVIGTVVVMSTRTYRKGISETGIQQEAQLAANNIGNLVKDACSVVYGESGQQYLENGEDLMLNPDSTPKMQVDGTTELSIITNEKIQYTVKYQRTDPANPHGRLFYQEFDVESGSAKSDLQIMANNIVDFSADTSDFKKSKTIKLKMTVEDEATNRRIPMEYTMTSRNDAVEGAVYVSHTDALDVFFPESDIVLVPGETYEIPLVVVGQLAESLEWSSVGGGLTAGALTVDYATVTVKPETTTQSEQIVIRTKDKDGNEITASCNILIRRVESVQVSHTTDTTNSEGGMYETAGTVYTFTASVSGNELTKHVAYDYDKNYKIAQAVKWSCVLKLSGAEHKYEWTSAQNAEGKWEFTSPDFEAGAFATYFEVDTAKMKEDALVPSFVIKSKRTMPAGLELTVRATSKHALGVNKADNAIGSKYYDKLGYDPVNIYYGEDTLAPRETKLNQGLEIILEPYETGSVKVGMKGGLSSDVTFDYHKASDLRSDANPNGTIAAYDEGTDTVSITLGKNEKGSGKTDNISHKCSIYDKSDPKLEKPYPYTFTVDVKVSGVTKTTITVHVCRIDEISIEVPKDVWHDDKGHKMDLPTYDFRARFNVDNGNKDDMDKVVKNLIQFKPDGALDSNAVENTLSSKITWELIDHNGTLHHTESVICMAGTSASDKGKVEGSYAKKFTKDNQDFYEVISVKPARVEQDGNNWYIKQLPEIDISLSKKDTATGLPKGYELKVTIEALHPGGKNKANTLYNAGTEGDGVWASISIFGEMTIATPTQLVIVEPGQGVNSTDASDKEMVVPITVAGGEVYSMSATISENSSSDTKLALYSGGNPYRGGKTTSANQSTWYLGLLIGEDEKGNHAGRIKVHVEGYNTNKEVIASYDFELGVRRVDNVSVQLEGGKKLNAVNKEGSTMTLVAEPKGCGNNGTEFYNIQKDEKGNVYRWEQKGHGEYIEPSSMEWKLVMKGVEKPLSEWTDYIDASTIKEAVNGSDHKATVSFKLKKMIPYGSKLRAYALHARGNNGKDEANADYKKYNKSAKKYANTYGELELIDDGFQRADEFVFVENIKNMREKFNDSVYGAQQRCFYRYRIKNSGKWTYYYRLEDESETQARFVGPKESLVFLPEYDYDVEIISVVYSKDKKLIYWPLDNALLEDGRAWKEEGFRLWNGDEVMKNSWYQDDYKNQMIEKEHQLYDEIKNSKEQWQWTFDVPKITINFEIGTNRQWKTKDTSVTLANMSASSPIHMQGSPENTWTPMDEISVKLAPTSFCLWKKQYHMNAYVDQKVNGQWQEVAVTESGWDAPRPNVVPSNKTYWHLQTSCPQFEIYQVYSGSSAEYRIRTMIKDMEWMNIEGRLFDRTYVGYNRDTSLFDMASGEGVLYLKFN